MALHTGALIGLTLSVMLGVSCAVLMSRAEWVEWSVWPLAIGPQCVPILALTPLIGGVYRTRLHDPEMISCILLTALLGVTVFVAVGLLTRMAIGRWYEPARPN